LHSSVLTLLGITNIKIILKPALLVSSHPYKQEKAEGESPSAQPDQSGNWHGELT